MIDMNRRGGVLAIRLVLIVSSLFLSIAIIHCSETGIVSHTANVTIINGITDPSLYGPSGEIKVVIDSTQVAVLTASKEEIEIEISVGMHEIRLVSTDPSNGRVIYESSLIFDLMVDGAQVTIRVTAEGEICFIGGELNGVPCEEA